MDRTTRAGLMICLWGICLFFFSNNLGMNESMTEFMQFTGFGWFVIGSFLFLKSE